MNIVEKEYEKDINLKREEIEILKEWISKQPHLPQPTELQLILFLQSCYYRIEATKTTIENYFTVRTQCPDIFEPPTVSILQQALSVGFITVMPRKTPDGNIVLLGRLRDCNPDNYIHINQIKLFDWVLSLYLNQNGGANGLVIVFDMDGSVFGHLTRINLMAIKKYMYYVQEALPVRLKAIHVINVVSFIDKIMGLVRPFMKKELIDMIHFHNADSAESLLRRVPKECLPAEYGGDLSMATLHDENRKNLMENFKFFQFLQTQIVDESKRSEPIRNGGQFGVQGTFKKLDLD